MTMRKYYEGLPAAANVERSIIQAQLQILKDLERRTPPAEGTQLPIDPIKRLAA
jgi:hypothetical protein